VSVQCSQCGAALEPAADEYLLDCPFCDTALVVDGSTTLFHEGMKPTLASVDVPSHMRRFLAGRTTAAGADKEAQIEDPRLEFFPFWAFTVGTRSDEQVVMMPAAPSSLQGLQGLALPGGDSRPMTAEVSGDAPVVEPEVPLQTAREWLRQRRSEGTVTRTVLYHLPLYRLDYRYKGARYAAAVDGVTGKVLPADYPAKAETPYRLVAALALVVFGIEGLLVFNVVAKALLYAVSAVPILGVAWWISRKV